MTTIPPNSELLMSICNWLATLSASELHRFWTAGTAELGTPRFVRDLVAMLEREQLREDESSTPRGLQLAGFDLGYDLGYRRGHNARSRSLIAWVRQGDIAAGLRELRDSEAGR